MKHLILLALISISVIAVQAQTDSLPNNDSLHQNNLVPKTIFPEKLIMNKQECLSVKSFYYTTGYKSNYNRYRYTEKNSVQKNTVEIVGNILLSILAGKTNHVYHSAAF